MKAFFKKKWVMLTGPALLLLPLVLWLNTYRIMYYMERPELYGATETKQLMEVGTELNRAGSSFDVFFDSSIASYSDEIKTAMSGIISFLAELTNWNRNRTLSGIQEEFNTVSLNIDHVNYKIVRQKSLMEGKSWFDRLGQKKDSYHLKKIKEYEAELRDYDSDLQKIHERKTEAEIAFGVRVNPKTPKK